MRINGRVTSIEYNRNKIATGGADGLVKIWDTRMLRRSSLLSLDGHSGSVLSLAWCPWIGDIVVSGSMRLAPSESYNASDSSFCAPTAALRGDHSWRRMRTCANSTGSRWRAPTSPLRGDHSLRRMSTCAHPTGSRWRAPTSPLRGDLSWRQPSARASKTMDRQW
jgi:hypothetical protein